LISAISTPVGVGELDQLPVARLLLGHRVRVDLVAQRVIRLDRHPIGRVHVEVELLRVRIGVVVVGLDGREVGLVAPPDVVAATGVGDSGVARPASVVRDRQQRVVRGS
jgi:hypothetical protein